MKIPNFSITGFVKILYLFFLFIGFTACSQYQNVRIPLAKSSYSYSGCEPSIDIHPKNNKYLAVGSILDGYHYSKDGGLSWTSKQLKSSFGEISEGKIL